MEEERKLGSPEEKDASPAPETKPAASEAAGSRHRTGGSIRSV